MERMEPVCYAAAEEDGTSGLVIEVFDDLDKVCLLYTSDAADE